MELWQWYNTSWQIVLTRRTAESVSIWIFRSSARFVTSSHSLLYSINTDFSFTSPALARFSLVWVAITSEFTNREWMRANKLLVTFLTFPSLLRLWLVSVWCGWRLPLHSQTENEWEQTNYWLHFLFEIWFLLDTINKQKIMHKLGKSSRWQSVF